MELEGLEEAPTQRGTKEHQEVTTSTSEWHGNVEATKTTTWIWHNGSDYSNEGWYTESDYAVATQDWEHGQVLQPLTTFGKIKRFLFGTHTVSGKRDWYGWQVDDKGYLTGERSTPLVYGLGLAEWVTGEGEAKSLKALSEIKEAGALLKKGKYSIYFGFKKVKIGKEEQTLLYIGKAKNGIFNRYSAGIINKMKVQAFEALNLKIPNNGIALGVEQRIMELNGWAGTAANKIKPVLSNKINATVKDIYLEAADRWLYENFPDWQPLFKVNK